MIDPGLQGRVALITGANNPVGIGASTALALARQGVSVFLTYLRLPPEAYGVDAATALAAGEPGKPLYHGLRMQDAGEVLRAIERAGGEAAACEADLSDAAQVPRLFDAVEEAFGPVDILVNNAAHYAEPDTIFTTTPQTLDRTFEVNVRAALLLSAEFVRRYAARGAGWGRIINLSTDAAQCFPGQIAYGASKATMEAFTRSLAHELGPLGITVNSVAPGPVQTGYIPADFAARLVDEIPLRRIGRPEEIADVIVFLASEGARWLTGQAIKISGGHAL